MPLCCSASTLQDLAESIVGSVEKGSSGDVCRVGGAGGKGLLATTGCNPSLRLAKFCSHFSSTVYRSLWVFLGQLLGESAVGGGV